MGLRILKRKPTKFKKKTKEKSAGSGMLVLPSPPLRGEGNISNPRVLSDMGLAIPTEAMATTSFEQYLKAQGKRNVRQIFCYEKKYHDVLETGDASALMQAKSPAIRRHVLQALCLYLKHTGCYNLFKDNRAKHQLGWGSANEDNLRYFTNYVQGYGNLVVMLTWLKSAL
jgi:hypothetical protein